MKKDSNVLNLDSAFIAKLMDVFKNHFNDKNRAIKTEALLSFLRYEHNVKTNDRKLRAALGFIRRNDMLNPGFIVSDVNTGYWFSNDTAEHREFINDQLNRMSNQFDNIKELHKRTRITRPKTGAIQISLF